MAGLALGSGPVTDREEGGRWMVWEFLASFLALGEIRCWMRKWMREQALVKGLRGILLGSKPVLVAHELL